MKPEIQAIMQKQFRVKRSRRFWISIISAALLLAGFGTYYFFFRDKAVSAFKVQTAKVSRGSISASITGSGTIVPSNRFELASKVNSTIRLVNFKEGDTVKKGDILVELDETDIRLNMDKTSNSILQSRLSNQTNIIASEKLNIVSPLQGSVSNVSIKEGDTINKGTLVATVTDRSRLKATFSFPKTIVSSVRTGSEAILNILDPAQSVRGSVTFVGNQVYRKYDANLDKDVEVMDIEVTIPNPGNVKETVSAYAQIKTANGISTSTDYATLGINSIAVKSEVQGTVMTVAVRDNQWVNAGGLLARLQNDDLGINVQTGNIKLQDLENQLGIYQRQLEYYRIVSPVDGTIVKQDLQVGDTAKLGDLLAIVSNSSRMQFTIPVDELDIDKVAVGQTSNVSVDALPDTTARPLKGTVVSVPLEGSTTNGVTSYDVKILVEQNGKLRNGMSANAEIFTVNKDNILYLPLEAVTKMGNRSFVTVKDPNASSKSKAAKSPSDSGKADSNTASSDRQRSRSNTAGNASNTDRTQSQGRNNSTGQNRNPYANNPELTTYYANTKRVPVVVGINNDKFIEIVSGLQLGDEVLLPPVTTNSNSKTQSNQQGFPGFGGMGGGFGGNRPPSNQGGSQNNTRSGSQNSNQSNRQVFTRD